MRFECKGCANPCCALREGEEKKIMLFPEEVAFLERQAVDLKQRLAVLEDLVFPDVMNKIILVASYRLYLEILPSKACGFMRPENHWCQILPRPGSTSSTWAARSSRKTSSPTSA